MFGHQDEDSACGAAYPTFYKHRAGASSELASTTAPSRDCTVTSRSGCPRAAVSTVERAVGAVGGAADDDLLEDALAWASEGRGSFCDALLDEKPALGGAGFVGLVVVAGATSAGEEDAASEDDRGAFHCGHLLPAVELGAPTEESWSCELLGKVLGEPFLPERAQEVQPSAPQLRCRRVSSAYLQALSGAPAPGGRAPCWEPAARAAGSSGGVADLEEEAESGCPPSAWEAGAGAALAPSSTFGRRLLAAEQRKRRREGARPTPPTAALGGARRDGAAAAAAAAAAGAASASAAGAVEPDGTAPAPATAPARDCRSAGPMVGPAAQALRQRRKSGSSRGLTI